MRRPTLDDAGGVAALLAARDRADFGEDDPIGFTADWLSEWWAMDEPALATDAWIALSGDEIVGYARATGRERSPILPTSHVSIEARGMGIGSNLLDEAERWARDKGCPVFTSMSSTTAAGSWHCSEGTSSCGSSGGWRSTCREAARARAARRDDDPRLPARRGRRRAPCDAPEAFAEHWEFTPSPIDEWLSWRHTRSDYHPALWQIAEESGEISGAALCGRPHRLGARPRGQAGLTADGAGAGVAPVRLRRSLAAATPASGSRSTPRTRPARRLYERAGMKVTRRYATYEKVLA